MMKLKEGFVLREVAGNTVVLPADGVTDLNMMITINGTGSFLWNLLTVGAERDELVDALLKEYDVDRERAEKNVDAFVARLKELNFLA